MKKITLLLLVMFSLSTTLAQETVTNRNGKEITVNKEASTTEKGIVKLAGDLGGTADVPTVPALTNKVEGNGTVNYISKFSAAKTLVNSSLFDNGTNVGLGTISPVSKFEISDPSETFTGNGTLRISNSSDPTVNNFAGLVFKSNNVSGVGGSWKIGSNQESTTSYNQNFHFLNSSNGSAYASKMTLTPAGYMGIGTTNPVAELSNTSTSIIGSNSQSSSSSTGFAWANTNIGWAGAFWSDYQGLNVKVKNTSSIAFEVGSGIASQNDNAGGGGSTPLFKVLTNGNVGIGVSSPIGKLNVNDATYIAAMPSSSTDLMNNTTFRPHSRFQVTSGVNNNALSNYFTTTAVAQQAHNYSIGTALPFILQPAGGNVGIGATAPANKLEITHGTAGNSGLRFTNLNSASTAPTTSSKVLGLNSTGDVILTNVPGTQNIVAFSTATPTTSGVVFTPATPTDQSVVYQSSVDNSLWTYNGSAYVTYTAPASTAWNLANTTNDAGSNKTSGIFRTGNVGIGMNNPTSPLEVQSTLNSLYATTARFLAPNNSTAGNSTLLNFGVSATTGNSADWRYVYQGSGATSNRVDFGMSGYAAPMLSYLNSGNVGIGTTAPATKLHIQGQTATTTINADAQLLRFSRPGVGSVKWDHVAQFNLGAYSTNINANTRLDLALNDGATLTPSNVMTWQANGNVGIGTVAPANKLEITHGTAGNSGLRFTNLNSASTASTSSNKVLAVNSTGDVILTNVPGTQSIIDFSTATPTTSGVVFTPNTPADQSVVYQSSVDNSMWTYNGTTYVTYTTPASTAWYTSGTTNDAGNSKTSNIYRTGNVGIGIAAPLNKLVVKGINNSVSPLGTAQTNATFRIDGDTNHSLDMGTLSANPFGAYIQSHNKTSTLLLPLLLNPVGGNVGVGTTTPTSKLEVDGASTNSVAYNAITGTSIDFTKSNMAYTAANPGTTFTLTGMKDGGTYTLAVQGLNSGTASFTGSNPATTAFTFRPANNGPTTGGKHTLYTFLVMGINVYYYMVTGL